MLQKREIDLCGEHTLKNVLLFTFPLILTGVLQLLFNAADIVVVGRFAGKNALAAVGSSTQIINLLVNLFIGLSVGVNVVVARFFGAKDHKSISDSVHTAMMLSILFGLVAGVGGYFASRPLLHITSAPPEIIDSSTLYLRLYFIGVPANNIYNFGSAILRSVGDTKRPLYFLTIAGVVNVILNLVFVLLFHMNVAGVAIATTIAQIISATLVVLCLMHTDGSIRLSLRKLCLRKKTALKILLIGIPAGLQSSIFSISNLLIQSSINSFGAIAVAGSAAAGSLEGFAYIAMNACYQTVTTMTSQFIGAGMYHRIGKGLLVCLGCVIVIGLVLGNAMFLGGRTLLSLYTSDSAVIDVGMIRLGLVCAPYFLCGCMDVVMGAVRGMGYSFTPLIVSTLGACGTRILWIFTIFQQNRSLQTLFFSYPVSWLLTVSAHVICFFVLRKKLLLQTTARLSGSLHTVNGEF